MSTAKRSFAVLSTVLRKELHDIVRDRRTLLLAVLLGPLMMPLLMLGMLTLQEMRMRTQLEEKLEVPVLGADRAPNLMAFLEAHRVEVIDPPASVETAIREQEIDVALEIPAGFGEDWTAGRPARVDVIHDSTLRNAEVPVKRVRAVLEAYGQQVGALRLVARGIDAGITRPLAVGSRDLATPAAKGGVLLSFLLPYALIFISFIGGASLVLDATAGERERESLEPLLTTPAPRGAIVSGKMTAAGLLGLLSVLLTLLALKFSALLSSGLGEMLDVRFAAIAKLLLILVPMVLIGNALLTLLASSAKSLKEAQSHMSWVVLLPLVPTMVLLAVPVKTQLWQFAVPFLAQNQMIQKVARGEAIEPAVWAVYLLAGFGLAAVLWFAAVHQYRQERLAIAG